MIERYIALRYLRFGKRSGFAYVVTLFSLIGIALGVATLVIVTSVMNGFRDELLDKIVGMRGHIVVTSKNNTGISEYDALKTKISKMDKRITKVIPQIEQQAVIAVNGKARGAMIQALSKESLDNKTLISKNIKYEQRTDFKDQSILIGKRMAEILGVTIGDDIELMIPDGEVEKTSKSVKSDSYKIVGIFEVGMNEYDKNIIIMPLSEAQDFWDTTGKVSQIEIFIDDVDNSNEIAQKIATQLRGEYIVTDWKHSDSSIFHAVTVEKNVMTLILSIIVLVAVFNIISGLTMFTNSKTKEIAILKTIGLTRKSILNIFLIIGSSIGVIGTTTGISLGLVISLNIDNIKKFLERFSESELFSEEIYFLTHIPSKTDTAEVCCIAMFVYILSLIATVYPAIKASRLDPVEALRI